MNDYVSVYGQDGKMLAVLDNADRIGYELKHNDLWTGSFSLPSGDPKNQYCQAHNLVRLPDGGEGDYSRDTGLYRVVGMPNGEEAGRAGSAMKQYSLEHVMATLLDDVLFGYHEVGGTGVYTADVIRYILSQQSTVRWQLGRCEFNDQFQYHFENVSLLSALMSLGEVLTQEYTWDWNTRTTPWTVSLLRADTEPDCGIHYGRNLVEITKSMDATALITRLYPLGYGEGVNQLTIQEVNGLVPYIDADTIGTWGVKCSVWTDTRIQDAAMLKARARQVLEAYKNPYISYTARAIDLYRLTGYSWDNYMPGKLVRVMDHEHGIDFNARIVTVSKRNVGGDPGDIEITIANATRDAADAINTLADRVSIGELYSQGATNVFAIPFADNADPEHPAKFRVYIPEGTVRINRMLLSWQIAAFRAYSTGAEAGGGSVKTSDSGGSSTQTTSTSDTVTYASESGGNCTITEAQRVIARTQDSRTDLIGWTFGARDTENANAMTRTESATGLSTGSAGEHHHGMGHTHTIAAHGHTVNEHHHGMGHTHTIAAHSHSMGHSHDVVAHSHEYSMTHHHNISSHSHTVNSHHHDLANHQHHFSGTTDVAWGHQHTLNSSTTKTGGVDEYADLSVTVSGYTGQNSSNTGDATSDTDSVSLATGGAITAWGSELNTAYTGNTEGSTYGAKDGSGTLMTETGSTSLTTGGARSGSELRPDTGDATATTDSVALTTGGARDATGLRPNTDDEPAHSHTIPSHSHGMDHFHDIASFTIPSLSLDIPAHGHNVRIPGHSHSVSIPSHTHTITLQDHTHAIQYGIYEGGRAKSVTIRVDGAEVPAEEITKREIDVAQWLSKDGNGRIRRGTWHEIQIVPDNLTRIEANLTAQVFVQSVGGGDY